MRSASNYSGFGTDLATGLLISAGQPSLSLRLRLHSLLHSNLHFVTVITVEKSLHRIGTEAEPEEPSSLGSLLDFTSQPVRRILYRLGSSPLEAIRELG